MRRSFLLLAALPALLLAAACSSREPAVAPAATDTAAPAAASSPAPASPSAPPVTRTPPARGQASGPAGHDADLAFAHVAALAREPRVAGTPAELRAVEYLEAQLASFGYDVERMPFTFEDDPFRVGEVRVRGAALEALTMSGSPGGTVEAPAVFVGLADDAGIAGRNLTGRIAVAERGGLTFAAKYQNVAAAGAIGLVVVNNQPGPFSGNLTLSARFPVVSVAQEAGAALLEAARAGEPVTLTAPPASGGTRAYNVIARPPGTAACAVIVGGHFDTVPGAPGANDNASGTANVLELARAFAVGGPRPGLCFALFGAEESGLHGSRALVERLRAENALPRYMVNLDVTGIGQRIEVIGDTSAAARAIDLARAAGLDAVPSRLPPNSGSDHMSFADAGVEVVFFTSGDFSTIHSPRDVVEAIDRAILDAIGDAAYLLVADLLREVG
ncbi:M28 family metallopeptidase [Tepidiforma thermophila]|uniref:PA domain-containing protein n=1 Tax=Tepidiforma thermophila (strain KCTC 52669 / CGMCC 1.13589 / G233) TaxID=2761530 RepID=A0A2A9HGX5_TEPT2|nr:M28 family metallopeptidase [Tepidiforma thermophila]PFG75274.1 PA domain-containing protein [Tepidiforma thermophila]